MYIQKKGSKTQTVLFDATNANIHPKEVKPENEQEEFESRR